MHGVILDPPKRTGAGHGAKPITVVGAGPAGLACAIVLARAGRRVIVRESRGAVGARFHGDFQGLENWSAEKDTLEELATSGIEPNFDHHPVFGGVAFDAWGKRYEIASDKPLYYLVHRGRERGSLDDGLLHLAQNLGVEVRFNDRVERTNGASVLAIGPRLADAIAVGYLFETDMADGHFICFDNRLAPLGYSYLLVYDGRGTVATCMFTDFKLRAQCLAGTVAMFRDRVGLEMSNPRPFGGIANFRLPWSGVQGGHLVIGEQAGFQDSLAGFGMRYALRSGILAARSLIDGVDYTRLWRDELLPLLRTSISNRWIFNLVRDRGWRWMLEHRLSEGNVRAALMRLYQPSLTTRLLFPLARWGLLRTLERQEPRSRRLDMHMAPLRRRRADPGA